MISGGMGEINKHCGPHVLPAATAAHVPCAIVSVGNIRFAISELH
jgi:hypothetical protein